MKRSRELSPQAQAAKMIRQNLKRAFPFTAFSVTSDSFAGGDAVRVSWTDGPTDDEVEAISAQHQYGSFDGSIDLYEYTNRRDDIPQSKYVHATRRMSSDVVRAIVAHLNRYYEGYALEIDETNYGHVWVTTASDKHTGNGWQSSEIHRTFGPHSLVCPDCKRPTLFGDHFCAECGAGLSGAAAEVAEFLTADAA